MDDSLLILEPLVLDLIVDLIPFNLISGYYASENTAVTVMLSPVMPA